MNYLTKSEIDRIFEKQAEFLIKNGFKKNQFNGLKEKLTGLKLKPVDIQNGYLPFVIVAKNDIFNGITKLYPLERDNFKTIKSVKVPDSNIYIIIDIDRGAEFLNISPETALREIVKMGKSPLTIDEGISIITQFPEFLIKNNCFSLLASRNDKDQRVPAIWINSKKLPNLGWCWDRNPHTWLGSASCRYRIS